MSWDMYVGVLVEPFIEIWALLTRVVAFIPPIYYPALLLLIALGVVRIILW